MASEGGTAYIAVRGDFTGFESDVASAGQQMADTFASAGQAAGEAAEQGSSSAMGRMGETMAGVLGANVAMKAGSALLGFGKDALQGAMDDAQGQLILANTLKNVTGATEEQVAANEEWISSLSKATATADDDLRPALSTLVRGFGDVGQAQAALALATDVAAGTGKDVGQVAQALAKGAMGSTGALAKLGVATKDASGNAKDMTTIMADLSKMFSGQAAASAGTAAGQMKGAQIQFGEFQEQLGTALLPALTALVSVLSQSLLPVLQVVADFVSKNVGWLGPLAAAIVAITLATKAWALAQGVASAATVAWTVVQTVFNAVMAANPIGIMVIAIAALVAGVILAYQKVDWFRALVDTLLSVIVGVFDWVKSNWPLLLAILTGPIGAFVLVVVKNFDLIKAAIMFVYDWVKANWPLLLAILTGPFGLAVLAIVKNFDTIKDAVLGAYNWVKEKFDGIVSFITGMPARIAAAASGMFNGIRDAFFGAINAVIRGWNNLSFSLPEVSVGPVSFGGWTLDTPNIPTLGSGGVISSPMLALLGERASTTPEIVAPENLLRQIMREEGGGGSIDARLVNYGTIYGVDDLDTWADERDAKLVAALRAGVS